MKRPSILTLAFSALLTLFISACGFQLRGTVPESVGAVYVSETRASEISQEIKRILGDAGLAGGNKLAAKAEESVAHIRVLEEGRDKSIFTLASTGRVREYQLKLRVVYSIVDARGGELIAPTELELNRIITYAETALTGKEQEEAFLYRDMRNEAVQIILRRLTYTRKA
jgi:LPS-assembly lipoprotein